MENFHKRKSVIVRTEDYDSENTEIISRFPKLSREDRSPSNNYDLICKRRRYLAALCFLNMSSSRSTSGCINMMVKERKTCIWPHGIHSWRAQFSGIMRVAVCGINSICVVTRNEDLVRLVHEVTKHMDNRTERFFQTFRDAIIHEVEDLESQKIFKKMYEKGIEKPFSIVAVISGTDRVQNALSVEFDEEKAVKFLQEEMQSKAAFTFDKTVQTAISGLQHLFQKKFKANEIRVFVFKNDGRNKVKELPSRATRSIEEHVALINESQVLEASR